MITHLLLEAAMRSLVMGAIIVVALRALRIEQVRARRTAWLLALLGALAMPVLVAVQIGPRLLPDLAAPTELAAPGPQSALRHVEQNFATAAATPTETALPAQTQLRSTAISLVVTGYCLVAFILALRLCAGIGFALRLSRQSERRLFSFDPQLQVRISSRISSPLTVASSVLLPISYTSWDEATLRVVLTHERAHVRQGDFYVQTLAGLHCALFWFNPFSWWLQRQLSELGEALSDCAAVAEAESRTSYAEILLAFATRASSPLAGVAMANASNLTPRIERLLSDRGFERSFAGKQRLPFIAAGVGVLALAASTSMVRVNAASVDAVSPVDAVSNANTAAINTAPASAAAPSDTTTNSKPAVDQKASAKVQKHGEPSGETAEEGIMAIHTDHSNFSVDSGDLLPRHAGDYIYFRHSGKTYLIEDSQIIAKAQTLLAPMKELGEQQRMLGHQQALLGAQQRMLMAQQRSFKMVDTPEFKREMAEVEKTIKDMKLPVLTGKVEPQALAEIQAHLGEIQARVGRMQAEFGVQFGEFGEQQGKLGEQQALIGEQQRKLVEEVRRQLKPIIEQAIREGRGALLVE
jgi:beta-lactamase regulating signal transducer with metallopeptidase domain